MTKKEFNRGKIAAMLAIGYNVTALEEAVYSFDTIINLKYSKEYYESAKATSLLLSSFRWYESNEGTYFWQCVQEESAELLIKDDPRLKSAKWKLKIIESIREDPTSNLTREEEAAAITCILHMVL